MPLEASSVIGAIAGVSEIAREAFGDSKKESKPRGGRSGGSVPSA
jgi:hypothetical protein